MSDDGYNRLMQKAGKNELSQYIISLVEKDLNQSYIDEQFQLVKSELSNLYAEVNKFKSVFQTESPVKNDLEYSLIDEKIVSDDEVNLDAEVESFDIDF
jgi:hypothetical protein